MTTDTESLEARLAAMTRPCNCTWCVSHDLRTHVEACICNGTGVVPLIAGSRRECFDCQATGIIKWQSSTAPDAVSHEDPCIACGGPGYVPDLDGMKVLAWMLEQDGSRVELNKQTNRKTKEPLVICHWDINERWQDTGMEDGTTPYEALLRACLAGAEAMEAKA